MIKAEITRAIKSENPNKHRSLPYRIVLSRIPDTMEHEPR